ncbi:MAG: PAS domain-containing sensor histidine kinase [Bacteroidales bacterium]|nr:PAS domain-containing sensor histidine kinase [Bacteroidales bacterium]MCF8404011.1 PAS domain-containing sensor histidine kinase [Bacteroidales bacterium]
MNTIIENSVRNSDHYARSLIEASLDPLVTISREGKITDVNEASVNITGIPRGEMMNTDFSNYFTDPGKARAGYRKVFEKGFLADYPLTIKHTNGNLTDVLYNASVYKDDKGNVLGVFASARDVTEQKWAIELRKVNKELAFQNSEREKRADELVVANKELVFQNQEKGKRAAELIIANKELAYQNMLKEKRAIDLVITNKELQQLIQLNKDKDKFFSIITHDLRSPFNSIIVYSEYLVEQINEKNYEKIGDFANVILESSNRAMDLLMNLMVWAKSQSGRLDFNPEYFDIITLFDEVRLLLNDVARHKSIHIECTPSSGILVNADKEMISSVLRNLISNAIKFTQAEGKITISAVDQKDQLTISVSDTGIGISKERINKLFNISDGYSTQGTQDETGTGLGLILCKEFIEKNGGKIWVDGEDGIGTTFYFSLPKRINNRLSIDT